MKATANNTAWENEGSVSARAAHNPGVSELHKKQIAFSVKVYSARSDRQAVSWMRGYNSVAAQPA